ncbi:hypothetical protein LOK49_LG01G01900 [Camellia lanceoleosa]|uniref:Uncharacterized protein n=1 Tax=Camellia lanceoleosa TaxID=1840588 RepID=A0ACC0J3V7_9ERIC|nr:hypothetical protein LOK49_LG01G01900 [Camellia lanceoleosa]
MALSLSKVLLSEGDNGNLEGKSSEEEDHLKRSTKKIKESVAGDDDTMLDNPTPVLQTKPLVGEVDPSVNKSAKPHTRSFKDALVDRRLNKRPFDEDLDDLSTDDEFESDGDEVEREDADPEYNYSVEYEHLHSFCFTCGRVGHRREWCSEKAPQQVPSPSSGDQNSTAMSVGEDDKSREGLSPSIPVPNSNPTDPLGESFGPWMLVDRKGKKRGNKGQMNGPPNKTHGNGGQKPKGDTVPKFNRNKSSTSAQVVELENSPQILKSSSTSVSIQPHSHPPDPVQDVIQHRVSCNQMYIAIDPEREATYLIVTEWWIEEARVKIDLNMMSYGTTNHSILIGSTRAMVNDRLRVRKILRTPDFSPLPQYPNSSSMKMLVWNCRGAGNSVFKRTLRELLKSHNPSIIVLMETKNLKRYVSGYACH